MLVRRIYQHEHEVGETLRSVASGEIEMVETITSEEERYARVLFGWIAEVGPRNLLDRLVPLLPGLSFDGEAGLRGLLARALGGAGIAKAPRLPELDGRTAARLAVLLMSYVFYDEFHYPQPESGVYDVAGRPFEKLKWAYRQWLNQLEVAERDSGLEALFAEQRLRFPALPRTDGRSDSVQGRVSVSCAGDLLAVDVLTPANTPRLFDAITDFFGSADIVSANLESTVDESRPVGRTQVPGHAARMNTSKEMFQKFRREARINFFSTATNHAMDWGESGLLATLDVLKDSGAYYSGTAASQAEQDDVPVVEKNGIRIGLLSYTFDLNGHNPPDDKPYLVNVVRFNDANPVPDYSLIRRHVATAKAKGADLIIAYCHWGWEFEMYPHRGIVEAAHHVVACGVDVILGNHQHVSQPAQQIARGADEQDALVVYGFGNFVSYHPRSRNSQLTYAIRFDIVKDELRGKTRTYLANVETLPLYIANERRADGSYDCRIAEFADVLADPDGFGLTEYEKSQLPHLRDVVWRKILSPISGLSQV